MSVWARIRHALRREKAELDDVISDATHRGDRALDQRERELHATPEEKLQIEQERAARNDEEFETIRRRIEGDAAE